MFIFASYLQGYNKKVYQNLSSVNTIHCELRTGEKIEIVIASKIFASIFSLFFIISLLIYLYHICGSIKNEKTKEYYRKIFCLYSIISFFLFIAMFILFELKKGFVRIC